MKVQRAVITAAAPEHEALPLQRLVDRDGEAKSALGILLGEVAAAGVDEVALVVRPEDEDALRDAVPPNGLRPEFLHQTEPRGYGDALLRARDFVGEQPFLHLVSDHLFLADGEESCALQLVEVAEREQCCVSAVQSTREHVLSWYGAIGGHRETGRRDLYRIERVLEKPTPTEAEQELIIPGLRAGHYLCFFGLHVLPHRIFDCLDAVVAESPPETGGQLSRALDLLAGRERVLAFEIRGQRQNIGVKYGLLHAQLALALDGVDRENVLRDLLEALARRTASSGR